MHTVERLEATLQAARQAGFQVRLEWLGGAGGGDCVLKGQKLLIVDLAQSPAEQLEVALAALARTPPAGDLPTAASSAKNGENEDDRLPVRGIGPHLRRGEPPQRAAG
jgi:hypothetical protein